MTPLRNETRRGLIWFCYANPAGFSGQKAATELVRHGLAARGWRCRTLPQPVLDRAEGARGAVIRYLGQLLWAWLRATRLLVTPDAWLCVNLGLTRVAFLRDAVPLFLGNLVLGRDRVVISLHGSLFMQWTEGSHELRAFRRLLHRAGTITVLGERQRARLIALGLPASRVRVVVNSCELPPLAPSQVAAKHASAGSRPLRALHLSSLIDTKGFPEYVEALAQLAAQPGPAIEAVLCGRLVASDFSGRFASLAAAERWLEETIAQVNAGPRVRLRWVRGAAGADKARLFHEADVFVLPTRYAVEAQPLVLLEAMAAGCAIVTTGVGEIPTILDESTAWLLGEGSAQEVVAALQALALDPARRAGLATAAHRRFGERYQVSRHLDAWENLLGAESAVPAAAPTEPRAIHAD